MAILDIVKTSLRISIFNTDFNDEINNLIEECQDDLGASGINPDALLNIDTDGNLRRVITLYCKAFFGLENPDKDWYLNQYNNKKAEMLNQITQYGVGDTSV
ncbi:DNA-packaging protein [Sinanaerobacter chloroacetimidivorans]|uniref:DNA-packaging protein n=1 Tax=Sinanaerobacter chloroacetimidivorans TaxID=2818044 RepID=A0A8J7W257_9FIRM|nr:DNA-packaging protein [Sinanaerobacter chloroacetimidivorans]MBR0599044.1 DNA-packaging protein [Sinanaerobacter chloroacetimidivorans]